LSRPTDAVAVPQGQQVFEAGAAKSLFALEVVRDVPLELLLGLGCLNDHVLVLKIGHLDQCFAALKRALQVVVIDLTSGDDAQVIFETLNARGEPLLPADLVRNYVFLRAARLGENQQELYQRYWARFDQPFWREQVTQGRLKRPRSDLFMQYFLASRKGFDVPAKHLFVEYKHWIVRDKPFATVQDELATLAQQGDAYRRLVHHSSDNPFGRLASFLATFETGTVYPLLLGFLEHDRPAEELQQIAGTLESYVLRRWICRLETKNYNNIFLTLLRTVRTHGFTHAGLVKELGEVGNSARWPNDAEFKTSWLQRGLYEQGSQQKILYILERLNQRSHSAKTELLALRDLTVEHLMPQQWTQHWMLSDGTKGLDWYDAAAGDADDPHVAESHERHAHLHTVGNLTLLTDRLNSSVSNGPWREKQRQILRNSALPLNQSLIDYDHWDVSTIRSRSEALFTLAVELWPQK
jgi:Protein of unknown function (DUF1524)